MKDLKNISIDNYKATSKVDGDTLTISKEAFIAILALTTRVCMIEDNTDTSKEDLLHAHSYSLIKKLFNQHNLDESFELLRYCIDEYDVESKYQA